MARTRSVARCASPAPARRSDCSRTCWATWPGGRMRPRAEIDGLAPTVHGGAPASAGTLLDFSVSTNPLGPSPRVRAAAAEAAIGHYPERDSATLRAALA